jgi:hypothetical protein
MQKDSVLTGFVLGAIVPVLGYILLTFLFDLLTQGGLLEEVSMSTADKRYRTILLLSLCMNLIPFQIGKKNRWDETMRGIVIPTMIYVGAWVYMFGGGLF